jgi:hypothetical protein
MLRIIVGSGLCFAAALVTAGRLSAWRNASVEQGEQSETTFEHTNREGTRGSPSVQGAPTRSKAQAGAGLLIPSAAQPLTLPALSELDELYAVSPYKDRMAVGVLRSQLVHTFTAAAIKAKKACNFPKESETVPTQVTVTVRVHSAPEQARLMRVEGLSERKGAPLAAQMLECLLTEFNRMLPVSIGSDSKQRYPAFAGTATVAWSIAGGCDL